VVDSYFIVKVLLTIGVAALLTPVVADAPSNRRDTISDHVKSLLVACGLITLAYGLLTHQHPNWAFGLAVFGFVLVLSVIGELLDRVIGPYAPRIAWVLLIVVCGGGSLVATDRLQRQAQERALTQHIQEEHDAEVAKVLQQAQTHWRAEPSTGVYEVPNGSLIAWLAVRPRVDLDVAYERELGGAARREIPINIRLMNNSFKEVELGPDQADSLWRLTVEKAAGSPVKQWNYELDDSWRILAPAERLDFEILWDGTDSSGTLVAPGKYMVRVAWAKQAGVSTRMEVVGDLQFLDAGPIRIVEPDPVQEQMRAVQAWAEHQKRMMDLSRAISDSTVMMNQMRQIESSVRQLGR